MTDDAVRLTGVSAGYGDRVALEDVGLAIRGGSLLAIIGPNGAGKSTLLKVIAGLLPARTGTVEVLGGPPGEAARRVAYVPQAELVDWSFPVTVGEVVMMGRYPAIGIGRGPGAADREAVSQALATVAMTAERDRQIGELSGGQRQARVPGPCVRRGAGPVPARRAGHRGGCHHPGRPDGRPRGRGAGRQDGHRHDPRPGLRRAPLPGGRAGEPPDRGDGSGQGPRPRSAAAGGDLRRPRPRPARPDRRHAHPRRRTPPRPVAGPRAALSTKAPRGDRPAPRSAGLRLHAARAWSPH